MKMKLRPLSDTETSEILKNLDRLWELSGLITSEARLRLEQAHKNHLADYSFWDVLNPLTSKLKKFSDLVSRIGSSGNTKFTKVESAFLQEKGFTEFLQTTSYGYAPVYFTEKKYNDLMKIAFRVGWFDHDKYKVLHYVLEKYAVHPVELTVDEIMDLDPLQGFISKLETQWQEYKDAL